MTQGEVDWVNRCAIAILGLIFHLDPRDKIYSSDNSRADVDYSTVDQTT